MEICKDLWQNYAMLAERELALRLQPNTDRDALDWPLIDEVLNKQEYLEVKNPLNWALDVIEVKGIDRVLRHGTTLGIFRTFLAIEKAKDPYLTDFLHEKIFFLFVPPINAPQNADRKVRLLEILVSRQKADLMKHFSNGRANYAFIRALEGKTYQLCDIIKQGPGKETTKNFISELRGINLNWLGQQTLTTNGPFYPPKPA